MHHVIIWFVSIQQKYPGTEPKETTPLISGKQTDDDDEVIKHPPLFSSKL